MLFAVGHERWRNAWISQVIAYYFPKLVDLHNYTAANAIDQKTYNWNTLNEKVLLIDVDEHSVSVDQGLSLYQNHDEWREGSQSS